jgi:hypothetical protein
MPNDTITVSPAAGPDTLSDEPLNEPTTIPPTTPAIIPANKGAPDANAIPKHKGIATNNTTIEEEKSDALSFKMFTHFCDY